MSDEHEQEPQTDTPVEAVTDFFAEVEPQVEDEVVLHALFSAYPVQSVASFSVMRGAKPLDTHLDPNCTEEELMAYLAKKGPGEYRIFPRLVNGLRGEPINRTVTRKFTAPEPTPASRPFNGSDDASLNKTVATLRAALDSEMAKARAVREKLEGELETEARKFRRELDDQDRSHRAMRRKLEDDHINEVNRLKQQVRELEQERDTLARKIREANDGTGVSQQVRDQIAVLKAEAELAPPPSEFDTVLAKGLEVLLPKLAGAFMGASGAAAPANEWKDPLATPPPPDEQH